MRPAGLGISLKISGIRKTIEDSIFSNGLPDQTPTSHGPASRIAPAPPDRRVDRPRRRFNPSVDKQTVTFLNQPVRERLPERAVSRLVFGHGQRAARLPIQRVADPAPSPDPAG